MTTLDSDDPSTAKPDLEATTKDPRDGGPPPRATLILAFLGLAQFMVFLDVSIVNVALPSIEAALHISEVNLPYVVTLYGTLLGGFLLFGSRLADTIGRRRVFQIGLTLFGLASLMGGLAPNQEVLFTARAAQGLGSALVAPSALAILTTTFTAPADRAKALGVWGALTGLASVAGVVLGGLLASGPGWRWIFFINEPIAIVAVLGARAFLPETLGAKQRFDWGGALVLTAALLTLIHSLDLSISDGWGDGSVVAGLAVSGILLAVFGVVETRASAPLVPFRIFRMRALRTANVVAVFLLGTVVTVFFFASLFMQQVLGYSALETGLAYVPLALIVAVGAGIATNLSARVPAKGILGTGLALVSGGLVALSRMPSDAAYLSQLLPVFIAIGLGMGLAFVPIQIAAQADVPEERAGLAAGLINTSQEVGGALGVAVAATYAFRRVAELTVAAGSDQARIEAARTTVFHDAFAVGAVLAVVALVISVTLMPRLPQHEGHVGL